MKQPEPRGSSLTSNAWLQAAVTPLANPGSDLAPGIVETTPFFSLTGPPAAIGAEESLAKKFEDSMQVAMLTFCISQIGSGDNFPSRDKVSQHIREWGRALGEIPLARFAVPGVDKLSQNSPKFADLPAHQGRVIILKAILDLTPQIREAISTQRISELTKELKPYDINILSTRTGLGLSDVSAADQEALNSLILNATPLEALSKILFFSKAVHEQIESSAEAMLSAVTKSALFKLNDAPFSKLAPWVLMSQVIHETVVEQLASTGINVAEAGSAYGLIPGLTSRFGTLLLAKVLSKAGERGLISQDVRAVFERLNDKSPEALQQRIRPELYTNGCMSFGMLCDAVKLSREAPTIVAAINEISKAADDGPVIPRIQLDYEPALPPGDVIFCYGSNDSVTSVAGIFNEARGNYSLDFTVNSERYCIALAPDGEVFVEDGFHQRLSLTSKAREWCRETSQALLAQFNNIWSRQPAIVETLLEQHGSIALIDETYYFILPPTTNSETLSALGLTESSWDELKARVLLSEYSEDVIPQVWKLPSTTAESQDLNDQGILPPSIKDASLIGTLRRWGVTIKNVERVLGSFGVVLDDHKGQGKHPIWHRPGHGSYTLSDDYYTDPKNLKRILGTVLRELDIDVHDFIAAYAKIAR